MRKISPRTIGPGGARQRLLDAAARVFARNGLEGATTREIAREAAVNEVTLFRHFKSKDKLLAEVVRGTFDRQEATLAAQPPADGDIDFRASLGRFAQRYHELLERNLPLLRTLIGEIHRHREHEMRVFKGIFAPLKTELLTVIESVQTRGLMRAGVDPLMAADAFSSMIFVEVLRRSPPHCPEYPTACYLETCVDLFARGIES